MHQEITKHKKETNNPLIQTLKIRSRLTNERYTLPCLFALVSLYSLSVAIPLRYNKRDTEKPELNVTSLIICRVWKMFRAFLCFWLGDRSCMPSVKVYLRHPPLHALPLLLQTCKRRSHSVIQIPNLTSISSFLYLYNDLCHSCVSVVKLESSHFSTIPCFTTKRYGSSKTM